MRRVLTAGGAGLLTAGALVAGIPAHATTFSGDLCANRDWTLTNGSGVQFAITQGCANPSFSIAAGNPAVTLQPGGSAPNLWQRAVERTGSECEAGWSPSWQQWARGGAGGDVCVLNTEWGGQWRDGQLSITITTALDDVRLTTANAGTPWVTGCSTTRTGRPTPTGDCP